MASIRERKRSDGSRSFCVLWRDRKTGRQTSLTFDAEREARVVKELIEAAGSRAVDASKVVEQIQAKMLTVAEAAEEHIELAASVSAGQKARYRQQVRDHIAPELGARPVCAIGFRDIQEWIQYLTDEGLSAKTVTNIHGLLSGVMKTAMKLGYRDDNPCASTRLPKSVKVEDDMVFLTPAEVGLILKHLSRRYHVFVLLLATGLRWGEATALRVADLELDAEVPTLRVTKAWKRDQNGSWYVGPPKTNRARRTISLSKGLVEMLRPIAAAKPIDELLFTNTHGRAVLNQTFWGRHWGPAIRKAQNSVTAAGEPDAAAVRLRKSTRVHDLRHTHASWMIAEGADMFVVQRRLQLSLGPEHDLAGTQALGNGCHLRPGAWRWNSWQMWRPTPSLTCCPTSIRRSTLTSATSAMLEPGSNPVRPSSHWSTIFAPTTSIF